MIDGAAIKVRYDALDERGRRRLATAKALSAGQGGIKALNAATGIARSTIGYGLRDLREEAAPVGKALASIRRKGAGRKPLTRTDPTLLSDVSLIPPRGDPMSRLKWTS